MGRYTGHTEPELPVPQGQQVPPELQEPPAPPELREPLARQELLVLREPQARQGPREPLVLQEPPAPPVLREPPVRREPRRHRNCFPLIPHRLLRGQTMPLWTLIRTGKPLARELPTRRETARLQSRHRGLYTVAFHTNAAPASGDTLPVTITLQLQQNGTSVPGAAAQHTFHTASENASMSFSFPVQVTAVPASLQVLAQGGNFLYSGASISIYKIN